MTKGGARIEISEMERYRVNFRLDFKAEVSPELRKWLMFGNAVLTTNPLRDSNVRTVSAWKWFKRCRDF